MKTIIYLFLFILFNYQCRYKNNEGISLQSVKTRLQKTWVLKEGISNGVDVTSDYLTEELSFNNVTKNKIDIKKTGQSAFYGFDFKHNKTIIFLTTQAKNYELKITKLTNKELWMEGDNISGLIGSNRDYIIKVKYNAK